jgi:hypothetical protein
VELPPPFDDWDGKASAIAAGGFHTLAIALPEPASAAGLIAGCLMLVALRRRHT